MLLHIVAAVGAAKSRLRSFHFLIALHCVLLPCVALRFATCEDELLSQSLRSCSGFLKQGQKSTQYLTLRLRLWLIQLDCCFSNNLATHYLILLLTFIFCSLRRQEMHFIFSFGLLSQCCCRSLSLQRSRGHKGS